MSCSMSGALPGTGLANPQSGVLSKLGLFDQTLDPSSPYFDFDRWSRTLVNLRNELRLPTPPRSGFVFKDLAVRGTGPVFEQQSTVRSFLTKPFDIRSLLQPKSSRVILQGLDGVLQKGELLLVLGRPGSGCTTFLKTITGEMRGLEIDQASVLHYTGIDQGTMIKQFNGELVYNQEIDEHLPYLTVVQTLEFAAAMRTPRARLPQISRKDRIQHIVEVMLTVFGLSQSCNTIVGNDYVRGVSGGERKRVSIAETALSEAAISAWDNSTRGLDAESALHFVHCLRKLSDLTQSSNAAAIYQSSQAIIDLFDKVLVLYEGRQVFFGPVLSASKYFEQMGWHHTERQTTGDFLAAVTNPRQRTARPGFENLVPKTPQEFQYCWHASSEYASLCAEIEQYQNNHYPHRNTIQREFELSRGRIKAKGMLARASQTISFPMQTALCMKRSYQQLWNDRTSVLTALIGEVFIALVVGSIFYGTPNTTDAFFSYGSVLFFAVLLNVLMSITDTHNLYRGRTVVLRQASYAFYRPSADALATSVVDIPVKFIIGAFFNVILYFLSGLATTASQFFTFFLFVFVTTLAMSMIFRTIAAATTTLAQAMAISGFLVLAFTTYTGFVLPGPYMHPWFKWITNINPLSYAFESLLVNQAHGTNYLCSNPVPPYQNLSNETFICPVPGAVAGESYVSGDAWFETSYNYSYSHIWRNLGILLGFWAFFMVAYLLVSDLNTGVSSRPNNLVFLRGNIPSSLAHVDAKHKRTADIEQQQTKWSGPFEADAIETASVHTYEEFFSWQNVFLDVTIKGQSRRLLDNASGWVQRGTLTALMGVSGAGKTTLLNTLAQRIPSSAVKGEFHIGGNPLSPTFKNSIGYVQQQDVHLETSTVREALTVSAILRQSPSIPRCERVAYVGEVIKMLGMEEFADAIIGLPGRGLNVEQRKRLSIGVELVGKPALLLFLDEPTSGLDNQSAEAILTLLRKLADGGLGILCTIHQPSAMLFQQFDRLLLMANGGRLAYFGDIGENSETVLEYFGKRAPRTCATTENPAEYLLKVIGNKNSKNYDWNRFWGEAAEASKVATRLQGMMDHLPEQLTGGRNELAQDKKPSVYAVDLFAQIPIICLRVFQQYWRSPTYIASKFMLGVAGCFFIGFSFFNPGQSIIGVQNAVFSVCMVCAMFSSLVQQVMPNFILQRELYEHREQHSNMYSWAVLLFANILAEIPYHMVLGVATFAIFNYTVFGIRSSEDQILVLLFFIYFYILAGTFAHMVVAPLPDATTAGRVTTILFSMMILFAGVFQTPVALPGFWIFMYRVSPMTYLIGGVATSGLSGNAIVCSQLELAVFQPPSGESCGEYLQPYIDQGAQGRLLNPDATYDCSYCPMEFTDQVLARSDMYYNDRWMNLALGFPYIIFNMISVFGLYYLFRLKINK